jgi:ABC-type sugar transport system substrate-binding protein
MRYVLDGDTVMDLERAGGPGAARGAGARVDRGALLRAGGIAAFAALAGVPIEALAKTVLTKNFGLIEIVASAFFDEIFNRPMAQYLKPLGWSLNVQTEQGQPTKGYAEAQEFILNNYGAIAISTSDPTAGWELVARKATQQGICFIAHNPQALGPATQNVAFDHKFAGIGIGSAAVAWARRNNVTKPVVGLVANLADPEGKKRTDYAWATIRQAFPGAQLAGQVNAVTTQQEGAAAAANLLSAHPGINMIITFNTLAGLGSYRSILQAGHTDPATFYLGTVDYETAVGSLIKQHTIYQSAWGAYFAASGILMARDALRFFAGKYIYPTRRIGGRAITTPSQVTAYDDALANPLARRNLWVFSDKRIVAYSPKRLATGQSVDTVFA